MMVGESLAILAVILVMAVMAAKSGRRVFATFTLPLASIPFVHLIGLMLRLNPWIYAFDVAGAVLGAVLCIFFSRSFRGKGARFGYLLFCCCFQAALLVAYLVNQM